MAANPRPSFVEYQRSLASELSSLQNRVRHLVPHWPTDGEYKEVLLRSMLRRHVPGNYVVGRGFFVTKDTASTQIDILITNESYPTLFRDGDVLVVTWDAVEAIIEVKTELRTHREVAEAVKRLTDNARLCCEEGRTRAGVWTGLFVYEGPRPGSGDQHQSLLRACAESCRENGQAINCIAYGPDTFVRYWDREQAASSSAPSPPLGRSAFWRSYTIEALAPSYFIGNLLDFFVGIDDQATTYAWFPEPGGKEGHAEFQLFEGETEPQAVPWRGGG